jgi:hypothetical protein
MIRTSRALVGLVLACAAVAAPPSAAATRVMLVDRGKPVAAIVVPSPPSAVDRRAAEILQSSVQKMSGAVVPIVEGRRPARGAVVVIGGRHAGLPAAVAAAARSLGDDGFVVATSGRTLHVVSGGDKGAIYGVVHLLEKYFGCRVYSPTASVFPRRDTVALGAALDAENPVNTLRVVNGDFSRDADYRDWRRLDLHDEAFGRGYYVHTFNRLVPWETYFDSHPEYFAWMNGKRIKDQLCLTNPDVLRLAIATLESEMAAQPDRDVWSVSQNDNLSYCQCDTCRKVIEEEGSPAGPIVRFVNAVAAAFPRKTISTLAYQYSRPAPKVTRPARNVQIMLCTIELNRSLPIAEDPGSRSFLKDIADWGTINSQIYLWDYTVNFSHHVSPFPNLHVLQPNIRFFTEHGARQHFQQTNTSPGHEFSELKAYLISHLLWNPAADVRALATDFFSGYYGAAGPWVQMYADALEAALARTKARLDIYEPPVAHAEDYLSTRDLSAYESLFDRAEAAVKAEPPLLERVKTARLPIQYARLEIGKSDMFGPRGFYLERDGRWELRAGMSELLEEFYGTCERNSVRTLNEAGLTPKAYYEGTKRFIDVQVEGNLAFRRPVLAAPLPAAKYGRGDVSLLTNGVRGATDFKAHWLGWEGLDFDVTVDLGAGASPREASIGTLWDARSWILHPKRVTCLVSRDGASFEPVGTQAVEGDQRSEEATRTFTFALGVPGVRYVRFHVEGTMQLPDWHPSARGTSWVFVDEIVVR